MPTKQAAKRSKCVTILLDPGPFLNRLASGLTYDPANSAAAITGIGGVL